MAPSNDTKNDTSNLDRSSKADLGKL
ncbi:unnamed protein product, partial [Rotaria magnacalcarata]